MQGKLAKADPRLTQDIEAEDFIDVGNILGIKILGQRILANLANSQSFPFLLCLLGYGILILVFLN